MNKPTHVAGGILAASSYICLSGRFTPGIIEGGWAAVTNIACASLMLLGAVNGSLIPDIEKKGSAISNKHKVISFVSRIIFSHRGFVHSLLALALLAVVVLPLGMLIPKGIGVSYAVGLLFGYGSHLVLDAFNPTGVPLFYPCKKKISLCRIRTGSVFESLFLLLVVCIIFIINYQYLSSIIYSVKV